MFRFHLQCPLCHKLSQHRAPEPTPLPTLQCGDCLMDKVQVVTLKVIKVEQMPAQHIGAAQ